MRLGSEIDLPSTSTVGKKKADNSVQSATINFEY